MSLYAKYAGDIAFVAIMALGFLGVTVSFIRNLVNRPPEKWAFAIAFVLFAVLAWHANKTDREFFEARLTGSKNYAYIHSRQGQKKNGEFLLYLQGIGTSYRVKIGIHRITADGQKNLAKPWIGMDIQDENANFYSLPAGRWEIDFKAEHTKWSQLLILDENDGVLIEKIEVRRDGEKECLFCRTMNYPVREVRNGAR